MRYRIQITTYDDETIEALDLLGDKRSKFTALAIQHFLSSVKGRSTFIRMTEPKADKVPDAGSRQPMSVTAAASTERARTGKTTTPKDASTVTKEGKGSRARIDLDKFL